MLPEKNIHSYGQEDTGLQGALNHSEYIQIDGKDIHIKDLCDAITRYKKGSRNFFVGDLQHNCSRMNRKLSDNWYPWTKEMIKEVDRDESIMRRALEQYNHAKIQELCKWVGGRVWNECTDDITRRLLQGVTEVESLLDSEQGMVTCCGLCKNNGVFYRKVFDSASKFVEEGNSLQINTYEYALYKSNLWNTRFENKKHKEEAEELFYSS